MCNFLKSICFIGAIIFQCNLSAQVFDPILSGYVESFQYEARIRGINHFNFLKCVKFPTYTEDSVFEISKQKPAGWDGVAIFYESGDILVFINRIAFDNSDEFGKEMIVYHELFHAYFNYPHVPGCLMMKEEKITSADAAFYRNNKKKVLDQVFNRIRK